MDNFSKDEIDVIGEISNICIGTSATTMNKMLGQPVSITTPHVELIHRDNILDDYENRCFVITVKYTTGLYGSNLLVLKEDDAKIITDLMMGNNGSGPYSSGEIGELHLSAISECMNQMTAASATAMSKMLSNKIDISPPSVEHVMIEDYDISQSIADELFVKIRFRMNIGKLIDSTILQLYPFDLARSIYKMFQRAK